MPRKRPSRATGDGDRTPEFVPCRVAQLPAHQLQEAARLAVLENPANAQPAAALQVMIALTGAPPTPLHLALLKSKWLGADGAHLTVQFLEPTSAALRRRIMAAFNLWGAHGADVSFAETSGVGDVRVRRDPRQGHYSFLGTDCRLIPAGQQTMNLALTDQTPDDEIVRVACHEGFHALGGPHEHTRAEIIGELDEQKTIVVYERWQGWSEQMVRQQVLTVTPEAALYGTQHAEEISIMTYPFPGSCTKSGRPIPGGSKISDADYAFALKMFPGKGPPPPPPGGEPTFTLAAGTYKLVKA